MVSEKTNKLINETSPYLLQHAHNPVDWYPWSEEAFTKAKKENKPILISIGYSACHWCHVMEHESFEDEKIARLMNDLFVCIKVDREERPEVDQIYMTFVQMTTGSGGWPLNVFLTPELEPYYGGTYFPPEDRYGRASWQKILNMTSDFYHNQKESLNKNLTLINEAFERNMAKSQKHDLPKIDTIDNAVRSLSTIFDPKYGGLGGTPKFPAVQPLLFFLHYFKRTGKQDYLDMVTQSLIKMAEGGIYDQLGGGFARYSVDKKWLVPHFEKMLYDNAQLVPLYLDAYVITKNKFFLKIVTETLDFVDRELRSPEGGFYASLDADSEGVEGKFYIWDKSEIDELLGEKSPVFCDYFDVTEAGNFEGKNILHIQTDLKSTAYRYKKSESDVIKLLEECRKILLQRRSGRVRPGLDDKQITSWNALMLSAYAKSYQVIRKEKYKRIIEKNIEFIKTNLYKNKKLYRTFTKGKSQHEGCLDDYAFLIQALIDAYEALFKPEYLEWAKELLDFVNSNFWDNDNNGYFYTAKGQKHLIYRMKDDADQSIPSGAGVMALNNLRLYSITEDNNLVNLTEKLFETYGKQLRSNSYGYSSYLLALDYYLQKPLEIVLAGNDDKLINEFCKTIYNKYLPNKIVILTNEDDQSQIFSSSLINGKESLNNKVTAYICHNFACFKPMFSISEFDKQLNGYFNSLK